MDIPIWGGNMKHSYPFVFGQQQKPTTAGGDGVLVQLRYCLRTPSRLLFPKQVYILLQVKGRILSVLEFPVRKGLVLTQGSM